MALALPDNGEVNNREVERRRLTSDSGGVADFEEEDEDEYEHHGELQNGEYDEEDGEPGTPPHRVKSLISMIAKVRICYPCVIELVQQKLVAKCECAAPPQRHRTSQHKVHCIAHASPCKEGPPHVDQAKPCQS